MTSPTDRPYEGLLVTKDETGRFLWALPYGSGLYFIGSTGRFATSEEAVADASRAAEAFDFWVRWSGGMGVGLWVFGVTGPGGPARMHTEDDDGG